MRFTPLLFSFFIAHFVCAQHNCSTFSLHEAYEMVKVLDFTKKEALTFNEYPSFDFKTFKPVDGPVDNKKYVKVGYNGKNEIKEIIHINKKDSLTNYRMVVFNYEDRRILALSGLGLNMLEYSYWPLAIMMDKRNNFNFMISTSGQTRFTFRERIWIEDFNQMSSLMILDENLMPTDLFRIRNGRVELFSQLKCADDEVKEERVHLFSLQSDHDIKIDFNTCPEILKRTCRYETPDLSFRVCPSSDKVKKHAIWIRLLTEKER